MIPLIPALPLLGAIANSLLNRKANRVVSGGIATLSVGLAAVLSFATFAGLAGGGEPIQTNLWTWFEAGPVKAEMAFRVDQLTATMMCIITGIGSLIHLYAIGYMDEEKDAKSTWRFFAYLNLFVFAMLLLVMGDNFLVMFVGWEGVGLCSYLLIGFWFENNDYASAGKKAFITNRVGDFSFVTGLLLLFWSLGKHATLNFHELAELTASTPGLITPGVATAVCLLFFGGATGKSAQIPLFVWLPDAMAGPTPVSALIHAATMVTSGIYMICRLNFLYVMSPTAMAVVATVGACTALLAATIAVTQNDIKKVLAYSTVSQLGFMFLGVGVGGFVAGFFHVMTHAFFKALMFLGSGSIIHALHHEQDMRKMGGLRKYMTITFLTFVCGWVAIIGVPGTSGFFSKDEIIWLSFATKAFEGLPGGAIIPKLLSLLAIATAGMTAFYMSRLMFMTFWGEYRGGHADHGHDAHGHDAHGHGAHTPHESPLVITLPLMVLAVLSLVGGFFNVPHWIGHGWLDGFLEPVFEHAHVEFEENTTMEFGLMGLTVGLMLASVGAAWMLYGTQNEKPKQLAERFRPLYLGSLNKWYVDEIYGFLVLNPLVTFSRQVLWAVVDAQIIDGVVNGAASAAQAAARFHSRLVSGRVQVYALSIAVGTAVLVFVYAMGGGS